MPGGTGPRTMLHYLGSVARDARREHGRKQIHIAVALDVSESTIRNFEMGRHWPRNPDATIAAYAAECGIEPRELWEGALKRWHDEGN